MSIELYELLVAEGYKVDRKGQWIFINCPFHSESTPSLGIKEDFFKCFGCGKAGSLDYLLKHLGITSSIDGDVLEKEVINTMDLITNRMGQLIGMPLDSKLITKTYRTITPETFKHFGVCSSERYPDEILFPIYNEFGKYAGLVRKPLGGKYKYNVHGKYVPYNVHSIFSTNLYIVEGVFDALSVWQAGKKNVISILGTGNAYKISQYLKKINAMNVKILFDSDDAGVSAAHRLHELYSSSEILSLPFGTDPNSCSNLKRYL